MCSLVNCGRVLNAQFKYVTHFQCIVTCTSSSIHDTSQIVLKPKANKSRLLPQHKNLLCEEVPYSNGSGSWIHGTEKYKRQLIGRYGFQMVVSPRICFKTQKDIDHLKKIEQTSYPHTIREMLHNSACEKIVQIKEVEKRENTINAKLDKLMQWKNELRAKNLRKEAEVLAAKKRKDRLIEDVRRHFGFKVDPRDERFKEMLEQKEREDKKKQKEAKRKAKEEKIMAKLVEKSSH